MNWEAEAARIMNIPTSTMTYIMKHKNGFYQKRGIVFEFVRDRNGK
jgi:hypothetical protein